MAITREYKCKDSNGGNSELYVMPYYEYSRSSLTYNGNYLTDMPSTTIYSLSANSISFSENADKQDGGATYETTVSFKLPKAIPEDVMDVFIDEEWILILRDNNGYYRIVGLRTGLDGKYSETTGAEKGDYNGYEVTFTGIDEKRTSFLESLDLFEIDLETLTADNINITADNTLILV